ncbi:unnamed protein product [Jaminaea pallidilutea]
MAKLKEEGNQVYLAVKSPKLGREGSISIVQLCTTAARWIVDLRDCKEVLGHHEHSLRSLLESPSITKVVYDCRNLADTLREVYHIELQNVCDLQVMQMMLMPTAKYNMGLFKAVRFHKLFKTISYEHMIKSRDRMREKCEAGAFWTRPIARELLLLGLFDIAYYDALFTILSQALNEEKMLDVASQTALRLQPVEAPTGSSAFGRTSVLIRSQPRRRIYPQQRDDKHIKQAESAAQSDLALFGRD